jgi:AcrR family transcriptional regulator
MPLDKNTNVRYYQSMNKGELTKTHILDQAVQLASVHGVCGLTIGSLAQHMQMSKGGICAHFSSKQALQLALIEHAAGIFQRAVILPTLAHAAGKQRLLALGEAWFAYLQQEVFLGGCFFTNVLLEMDDIEDMEVRAAAQAQYQRFLSFVQSEADAALRQGQFKPAVVSEQFVFEFVGLLVGTLVWRGLGRQNEGIASARRLLEAVVARAAA